MTLLFATLVSLCPKPFHHISHHTSLSCLVFNTMAEDIYLHILPLGLQHWSCLSWSSCGDPPCFWFAFNHLTYGLPRWRSGKKSACQCRRCKRYRVWRASVPVVAKSQAWLRDWKRLRAVSAVDNHLVCSSIQGVGTCPELDASCPLGNIIWQFLLGITACCESDVLMYQHSAICIVLE